MKKIIIALICVAMLWGCTPKNNPTPAPEPEKHEKLPLPLESLYGYWVCDDDLDYIGFLPDGDNTNVDIGNLKTDGSDIGQLSDYTGDEGVYELKISYSDGKLRLVDIDCLIEGDGKKISVSDKEYVYLCGFDGSFDWLRYDYLMNDVDSFFELTKGYWNSDDGAFIRIWENEEGKKEYMNGLYDAGGPASGYLNAIATDVTTGTTKFLTILVPGLGFPPFPEKDEYRTIALDMEAISEKIIILDGRPYFYAGSEWDDAYNDFVARVHH